MVYMETEDWDTEPREPSTREEWFHGKAWRDGRTIRKFVFNYRDIAEATGLSVITIKIYASKKVFDPTNLASLSAFVAKYIR